IPGASSLNTTLLLTYVTFPATPKLKLPLCWYPNVASIPLLSTRPIFSAGTSVSASYGLEMPVTPGIEALRGRRILDRFSRSEEHTSELQSRENLVCRLLLEKKNTVGGGQ